MIDSKELLKKTSISRATLNNYIRLGIIPKPIVKKLDKENRKIKKIGYFSESALEDIKTVKRLKKEGNSIDNIANIFRNTFNKTKVDEDKKITEKIISGEDEKLTLTIDNIETPAYLINYKFEIEWINHVAEEEIFQQTVRLIKDAESRNIFKLLFNMLDIGNVKNLESIVDLHMTFLKSKFSRDEVFKLYSGISEKEINYFYGSYDRTDSVSKKDLITQTHIDIVGQDGNTRSYRLYITFFREGLFFFYEPSNMLLEGVIEFLTNRSKVINELLQRRMPALLDFCVLVADLHDSVRICAELPPEEYFELINQMRKNVEESFRNYYGIYGKHAGDGLVYYFLKDRDSHYIVNSLYCAMEIKNKMEKLSAEWKVRKRWDNELYLNIGINEGQEYFSAIHASTNIEFAALGDTINYASRLSDLACYGSILTTKNLINRMAKEDRQRFIFGIKRKTPSRGIFIENMFSRVVDFIHVDDPRCGKFMDIAVLPITEIIGRA